MRNQPNDGSDRRLTRTRTPGIYRRGDRYVVTWRDRGRQRRQFFPTYAEAREAKRQRSGDGDRRKPTRVRVRDHAPRWIGAYRGRTSRGFDEDTRRLYRRDVERRIVPYFGGYWLDEVGSPTVRAWFVALESEGASHSAIRRAKATLSAMFADAKEDGLVRDNPVAGVRYRPRTKPEPKARPKGLTLAELERVLSALPPRWRLFHVLLAHTGVRIGEALGWTWADVHLGDDPRIEVRGQVAGGRRKPRPKSHHGVRTIPLSPALAQGVTRWKQVAPFTAPGDPVFANEAGQPLDYSAMRRRVLRPAIEASGVDWPKGVAFHMFRRTAATILHHHGKSGRQLRDWLGHHDPAFTIRTYVGEADEGLGDATFLDELIAVDGSRGQRRDNGPSTNGRANESGDNPLIVPNSRPAASSRDA